MKIEIGKRNIETNTIKDFQLRETIEKIFTEENGFERLVSIIENLNSYYTGEKQNHKWSSIIFTGKDSFECVKTGEKPEEKFIETLKKQNEYIKTIELNKESYDNKISIQNENGDIHNIDISFSDFENIERIMKSKIECINISNKYITHKYNFNHVSKI